MGVGGHDGIMVDLRQYQLVFRITQVLDGLLQPLADLFDLLVVASMEEHVDGVWPVQQFVAFVIVEDVVVDGFEPLGIEAVVGIFDDHFLAEDVPLRPESQHPHGEALVEIDVEHHRVLVGLIGEEGGDGGEGPGRDGHAEAYSPLAFASHPEPCVVEDIVDDEHQHRHDDGYAEAALADDGSQRGTDKEEDQARE